MRIVLATFGSLGDIHPVIALGLELQRRGHHAAIVTSEYHRERILGTGLGFHDSAPDLRPDDRALIRATMDERRGPEEIVRFMVQYLPQMYGDYERAINADGGADLLITSDLAYAGPILAEKTGINWASQVLSPLSFLSAYDESVLPPLPWLWRLKALGPRAYGAILGLAKNAARRLSEPITEFRRSLALAPKRDAFFDDKHSPRLVLAMFSRLFGEPRPDWPPQAVVTGFAFYDGDNPALSPEIRAFIAKVSGRLFSHSGLPPSSIPGRSSLKAPVLPPRSAGGRCSSARQSRTRVRRPIRTSACSATHRFPSCFPRPPPSCTRAEAARPGRPCARAGRC